MKYLSSEYHNKCIISYQKKELYLKIIKSVHRYRMKIETVNNQLFIYYNMPDL